MAASKQAFVAREEAKQRMQGEFHATVGGNSTIN